MDCSMPGLPVHHYLLEFAQTHVHWIDDAVQPSHPRCPLLLLPSIFPSIRVFSNESALHIRWPKYWSSALASVLLMNIQHWFPLRMTGLISLQSKGLSRVFSRATVQKHHFSGALPSSLSSSHICIWLLERPKIMALTIWTLESKASKIRQVKCDT